MLNTPYWLGTQQLNLDGETCLDEPLTRPNTSVIIGQFFEYITCKLFFGELCTRPQKAKVDPDVILANRYKGRDILIECKATSKAPIISLNQIHEYKKLEYRDFPFTRPRVFYAIYIYNSDNILSECFDIGSLITYLCQNIQTCLLVPIDVLLRLSMNNNGIVYKFKQWRYSGEKDTYIRWPSRLGRILELADRSALRDFLDLVTMRGSGKIDCFKDYAIRAQKTRHIKVNGDRAQPFTVLSMNKNRDWRPVIV